MGNGYEDSIVINALDYSLFTRDYMEYLKESKITAVSTTVTALHSCRETMDLLGSWYRCFRENGDIIRQAFTAGDIERAKQEGKVAVILNFQNTSPVEDNLDLLALYKRIGVNVIQITYNQRNLVGDGCIEKSNVGLSDFGRDLVRELNALNILIDLSHVGERTSLEAIEHSEQPCAFTHANPSTLYQVARNKSDECLKALAEKGGVVGANAFPTFLSDKESEQHLDKYLDNIDYLVDLLGVDQVGVGTDFVEGQPYEFFTTRSGIGSYHTPGTMPWPVKFPKGVENSAELRNVWDGLLKRNYSEKEARAIMGGNFLRLFKKVWGE